MDLYSQQFNGVATISTPTQAPVIETLSRQLEKEVAELEAAITALESRLAPVMCEPEPSQTKDNPKNISVQSLVAASLNSRIREVEGLTRRLSSIMRRLEV